MLTKIWIAYGALNGWWTENEFESALLLHCILNGFRSEIYFESDHDLCFSGDDEDCGFGCDCHCCYCCYLAFSFLSSGTRGLFLSPEIGGSRARAALHSLCDVAPFQPFDLFSLKKK
jgi:hypothetical protein